MYHLQFVYRDIQNNCYTLRCAEKIYFRCILKMFKREYTGQKKSAGLHFRLFERIAKEEFSAVICFFK